MHKQIRKRKVSHLNSYLVSLSTWVQYNRIGTNVKQYQSKTIKYLKAPQPHYTKVLQACQVLFLVNFIQALYNDPAGQSAGAKPHGKSGRFLPQGKGPLEFPEVPEFFGIPLDGNCLCSYA